MADVGTSARLFAGEIQRDLSLRVTDDPQQLDLGLMLIAAKTLTLGDFTYFLRLCHNYEFTFPADCFCGGFGIPK